MRLFGDASTTEAREIIKRARERFQPVRVFALFSGGNDSTSMVHMVRDLVDEAVHIDTGIGIPETRKFVEETCHALELPLVVLETDPGVYRDIVLGDTRKGFPGPAFHYITYHRLKSQRLQELQRDRSRRGERLLLISGVRSAESGRRMRQVGGHEIEAPRGRLGRCAWANPIVHFSALELAAYREAEGIEQSPVAALIHKSGECLCGAFARPGELEELEIWFPETAAYIRSLEREATDLGKRYPRWGERPEQRARPAPGLLCSSCQLSMDGDTLVEELAT
jgi:3'-phosphoadenosine 5'-phosphosulfate sulfotransferase (PAPS reductase)/FAD synthetase